MLKPYRIDWRLTFYNLRKNGTLQNNVGTKEKDEIWIPNLLFANSIKERLVENDKFSILAIEQNGTGVQETDKYLQENMLYKGSENAVIYSRTYTMDLGCEFEQHSFPFDTQTCSIEVIF